jgi:hypothetical protein
MLTDQPGVKNAQTGCFGFEVVHVRDVVILEKHTKC